MQQTFSMMQSSTISQHGQGQKEADEKEEEEKVGKSEIKCE
jgi:hypothetical protein